MAIFNEMDPSLLGDFVAVIAKAMKEMSSEDERNSVLTAIGSKRVEWLKREIQDLDKPFSWDMAGAEFPDNKKVEEFLRGPKETMKMTKSVRKFKGFKDARNYAANWTREKQINASFEMEASSTNGNAIVTITKTRKWFTERQQNLQRYKAELSRLMKHGSGESGGDDSDKKRARVE